MEHLEQAVHAHNAEAIFVRVDPILDPLRKTPRFQALLEEAGLAN